MNKQSTVQDEKYRRQNRPTVEFHLFFYENNCSSRVILLFIGILGKV